MLIAQISDIHAAPENDNLTRLHAAISWIQSLQPDLLVVTGNLIDQQWVEGYPVIERELQRLACRVLLLPGNSDVPAAMRQWLQSTTDWPTPDALHFSEQIHGLPIVGVDTTLAGETGGDISRHLPWLTTTLARFSRPALIFTHHHLFASQIAPIDQVMCQGAEPFWQAMAHHHLPPLAVCSGHVHRTFSRTIAGIPAIICGSICPANPLLINMPNLPPATEGPVLMIHNFSQGSLVSSPVTL